MTTTGPAYMSVQEGSVVRTIECGSGILVDVDADGRVLGIESLDSTDFFLAMFVAMRRLRVSAAPQPADNAHTDGASMTLPPYEPSAETPTVPVASDFPWCRPCQLWSAAGASWPRPCAKHYGGEQR